MKTVKCKLLEISHSTEYLNDFENVNNAIVHQFTNWEEVNIDDYYELEEYVKKQNIEREWNGKSPKEGLRYLILVREPSPDLIATTIKEMLEEKEAERIAEMERIKKTEKARLAAEKKKEEKKLEKLRKKIKDLEKLKAEEAELQKKL